MRCQVPPACTGVVGGGGGGGAGATHLETGGMGRRCGVWNNQRVGNGIWSVKLIKKN